MHSHSVIYIFHSMFTNHILLNINLIHLIVLLIYLTELVYSVGVYSIYLLS